MSEGYRTGSSQEGSQHQADSTEKSVVSQWAAGTQPWETQEQTKIGKSWQALRKCVAYSKAPVSVLDLRSGFLSL